MNDNDIAPRVRALLVLLGLDPQLVQTAVEQDIVYVEGLVPDILTRQAVEANLRRLDGVRQVVNCLAVEHVAQLPHAQHMATWIADYRRILFDRLAGSGVPPGARGVLRTTFRDV
jgi:hypothetical protein